MSTWPRNVHTFLTREHFFSKALQNHLFCDKLNIKILDGGENEKIFNRLAILLSILFTFVGCGPNNSPETYIIIVTANSQTYGAVTGSGEYEKDSHIIITATAKAGYYFDGWSDGNDQAEREIVVTANKTYTAIFKQIKTATQYRLASVKPDMWITAFNGNCGATRVNLVYARIYPVFSDNHLGSLLAGVNENCQTVTDTTGEVLYASGNGTCRDLNNPIIANGKNINFNVFEEWQTVKFYIDSFLYCIYSDSKKPEGKAAHSENIAEEYFTITISSTTTPIAFYNDTQHRYNLHVTFVFEEI